MCNHKPDGYHKNNFVAWLGNVGVHVRVCMLMVSMEGVRETIVCHALSTPASSCLDYLATTVERGQLLDGRELGQE